MPSPEHSQCYEHVMDQFVRPRIAVHQSLQRGNADVCNATNRAQVLGLTVTTRTGHMERTLVNAFRCTESWFKSGVGYDALAGSKRIHGS